MLLPVNSPKHSNINLGVQFETPKYVRREYTSHRKLDCHHSGYSMRPASVEL